MDRVNSLSAIFFAFVAVIVVTAFRGKSGSKNRHFCNCADGRMYLTITHLVKVSWLVTVLQRSLIRILLKPESFFRLIICDCLKLRTQARLSSITSPTLRNLLFFYCPLYVYTLNCPGSRFSLGNGVHHFHVF